MLLNKTDLRVFFSKKGRAVYISHLDLLRTMQRALKRSGLPVWYSEGFNPRIYLNFPLALSLGVEGECEPMDLCVTEEIPGEEFAARLSAVCPEGIGIISAGKPVYRNKDIGSAQYLLGFSGECKALSGELDKMLARDTIEVMKHSKKKGMISVDIKPHIIIGERTLSDRGLEVKVCLPAGSEISLNCGVFSDAFTAQCMSAGISTRLNCAKRTNIYCKNGDFFK